MHPRLLIGIIGTVTSAAVAGDTAPAFYSMGDLPGGRFISVPSAVSADGSTVVGFSVGNFAPTAVAWTADGGLRALSGIPQEDFVMTQAYGVSANGRVVAGEMSSEPGSEAFRWSEEGGLVGLGDAPGGGFGSVGRAVSGDGQRVFGGVWASQGFIAASWNADGVRTDMGDLIGGNTLAAAMDCSNDGRFATGNGASWSGEEAFRWTSPGIMQGIGDLPGGNFVSAGRAISDDGAIIAGYSQSGRSSPNYEAFRWTSTGMMGLGDLPGGDFESSANAMTADGSIIVGYSEDAQGLSAFIWDAHHGMRSLRDLLVTEYGLGDELEGWQIRVAVGISADGTTIAGSGINPSGLDEGWIVRIPEPGHLGVLIVAAVLTLRRRGGADRRWQRCSRRRAGD